MGYSSDCIVVGGGLAGLFSALALRRGGLRVTLLERERAGAGASGAAGGILCPLAPWREPAPVLSLAARALDLYDGRLEYEPVLAEELQTYARAGRPLVRRPGLLHLWCGRRGQPAGPRFQAGNRAAEDLDEAGLRALAPGLDSGLHSALWLPWVLQADSPRLARAACTALRRAGARVREGEAVQRLELRAGRLTGLETARGRYSCACIVLAAGAWNAGLLVKLGAGLGMCPGLEPVRGQMLAYRAGTSGQTPGQILVHRGRYVVPCPDGRLLVGSTVERSGFNAAVTARARRSLRAFAGRLLPALRAREPVAQWAGLRPATADGVPRIGPVPGYENLYLNTGYFRNGVLLAPAAGELLARLILDGRP